MQTSSPTESASRNVIVTGDVSYRAGDGTRLPIRPGLCEMEETATDVTLGWQDGDNRLSAVIPQTEFKQYLKENAIHFETAEEAAGSQER